MESAADQEFVNDERVSGLVPRLTDAETALRAMASGEAISSGRMPAARVLDDARGALLEAQQVLRGLETRAHAVEALEAHARRYRKLVENSVDVLILCSAEGIIKDAHGGLEQMLGYSQHDQTGRAVLELVHPSDQSAFAALFAASPAGRRFTIQYRMQRKDGSWCWLEGVLTNLLDDPDVRSVVVAQRDITPRIDALEALRISEERCRASFESGPEAMLTLDLERGKFVEANENAVRLLGYSRPELLLTSVFSLSSQRHTNGQSSIDRVRRAFADVLAGNQPTFEWLVVNASGEEIPLEVRLVRFPDATRQLCRMNAVDIRARKRADERRARSVALDLLTRRCAALAGEFAVWARVSETVLREVDIQSALASALHACFDAGALCVGALYLLDEKGVLSPSCLGTDCGWSADELSTFFGQELLLRRTMQWGVATEIPSPVVPEPLAQDLLRRCHGSSAVIVPLRYQTTPLGACVIVSRTRTADREDFRTFANGVANQITQVLTMVSAFAEKETLRRQAAEQAKLLRLILDSMGEGVQVADRSGHIVLENRAALQIAMAGENTALRDRPTQLGLFHGDGETLVQPDEMPLARAVRGESIDNAEICQRPPGSNTVTHFRVTARPLTTEEGELQGGVVVIHDVTEEKKAYSEVLASRAEWQSLVEHVPDFILKLDLDGVIQFVNRLYPGLDMQAVIGTRFGAKVVPEHQPVLQEAFEKAINRGERSTCEVMGPGPGRALAWYSVVLGPIRQHGDVVGALATMREITQEKLVEAQLAASDRMASVGALATGLAHEINNPLSSLIVNLTLAARDGETAAAGHRLQRELLDEIRASLDAAERVRQIILDLRILAGRDDERRDSVDVEKVLESTLRLIHSEIRPRAKLVRNYTPVPPVVADESRLGQVLLNLILNAAQAVPEGNARRNEIRLSTRLDDEARVVIEIEDTGEGMSPEVQARAFEPFFTTKPRGVATGLGLATCQRIVTQLGGELSFVTHVGEGTKFSLALPAARTEAKPVPAISMEPTQAGNRRGRILIVDDDETVTAALKRVLSAEHDLTCVESAPRALELLARGETFDVILCDLLMPQVSGMELHEQVSRLFPQQAERFVFTTGGAYTPRAQDFLDAVPNLRIEKPFEIHSLTKLVRGLVQ